MEKVKRNWGYYEILLDEPGYKVKRLTIKPGCGISYQYHLHRNEHWINIQGHGEILINDEKFSLLRNKSIYIKKNTKHKLDNIGKIDLIIMEIQTGEYFGEDDITRL